MGAVVLSNIHKSFDNVEVVKDVSLHVADGEFVVVVGPSGCGKSTLLRIVAGLEDATTGSISIDGQDVSTVPPSKREIAMVFQSYALYPHLNARNNMALGLKQAGTPTTIINDRVNNASTLLELDDYLKQRPAALSGGQRQRVAIGRAIVREPKVFLFDEPLSNLDATLRVNTRIEISRLHHKLNATIIYVTHDQTEAMTLADRIVVLNNGMIEQIGSPMELYNNPTNIFVAGFIGSPKMNFINADVFDDVQAHTIGIRPEDIAISRESGIWPGEVVHAENLGPETMIYIDCGSAGTLTSHLFGEHSFKPGEMIQVTPNIDRAHRFNANGQAIKRGD